MSVLVTAVHPRQEEGTGEIHYVLIPDPDRWAWVQLVEDLAGGEVLGAALIHGLSEDGFERARAFPGCLVARPGDDDVVHGLVEQGWGAERIGDDVIVLVPPGGMGSVQRVSRDEFGAAIDGAEPIATEIELNGVDLADEGLFGVFAAGRLGGSCALLSLSGASSESGPLVLRNPAALGLERADRHPASLSAQTQSGAVRCAVVGASRSFEGEEEWHGFADGAGAGDLWRSLGADSGGGFWLMLELTAPEVDPPVWMPAGQIFEQRARTGRQTLATTAGVGAVVSPGQLTVLLAPAYCLDSHLGPPAGDPMAVTPLRMPLASGATQGRVWHARRAARDGLR